MMHYLERRQGAPLRPWVNKLWALRDSPDHTRERILPSGTLELVINLHDDELRIYHGDDPAPQRLAGAVVSGAYDRAFGIDTREHASVIGVHFEPAGASAVLGVPAGELQSAHVELEALWGPRARRLRERLCLAASPDERFDRLEAELRARLTPPSEPGPIAFALERLQGGQLVASVAAELGISHRRFIQ